MYNLQIISFRKWHLNTQSKNNNDIYFITTTIVNWIDLFTRTEYSEIIIDLLNYSGTSKGLNIHAWCLMPSHLHLIVSVKQEIFKLPDIMRDLKNLLEKKLLKQFR